MLNKINTEKEDKEVIVDVLEEDVGKYGSLKFRPLNYYKKRTLSSGQYAKV